MMILFKYFIFEMVKISDNKEKRLSTATRLADHLSGHAVGRPRVVINGTALDYLAESLIAGDPHNSGVVAEFTPADWQHLLPYLEENE